MSKGLVTNRVRNQKASPLRVAAPTNSPRNKDLSVTMMVDQERSPYEEALTGILFSTATWGAENERKAFDRSSPQGHVSPLETPHLQSVII